MQIKFLVDGPGEEWVIRASNLRNLTIVCDFAYGGPITYISNCRKESNCMKTVTELEKRSGKHYMKRG